jgi:hypothetical protein
MNSKSITLLICTISLIFPNIYFVGNINANYISDDSLNSFNINKHEITKININDWKEIAKLTAFDGDVEDRFGYSVDISGDYVIIGSYLDDDLGMDSGSAYVFRYYNTDWVLDDILVASDALFDNRFGTSVSINGDYAIVGSPGFSMGSFIGAAYIFKKENESWVEVDKITASDGDHGDFFGGSVSIHEDYAIVGAQHSNDSRGAVYIFKNNGSDNWIEEEKLTVLDWEDRNSFGHSLAFDGKRLIVGAPWDDMVDSISGSVYIFMKNETSWFREDKLIPSDGDYSDRFGYSVSIHGEYAIIGNHFDDDFGSESGSAYIFKYNDSGWVEEKKLTASDGQKLDLFGSSVDICNDVAIVGAKWDNDNGDNSGSVYIFKNSISGWVEEAKLTSSDGYPSDLFGESVAIDENYVIISSPRDDDYGIDSGSAYIFKWEGNLEVEIQTGLHIESFPIDFKNIGTTGCSNIKWELTFTKIIRNTSIITSGTFLFIKPDEIRTLYLSAIKLFSFKKITAKAIIYDQIFVDESFAINFGPIFIVI